MNKVPSGSTPRWW